MKILVTGGAGFIGSHLVDALLTNGHAVAVVDNLSTGVREQVDQRAEFHEADVADAGLAAVVKKVRPEAVVHLAAQVDVRKSVADPVEDARVNILGTLNVLEAARQAGVRHFIFASSGGAIYGDTDLRPTPESHPAVPASPYGIGKLSGEHFLRIFHKTFGMRTVALRYANVYGPRQNALGEAGVVAIFTHRLLAGQQAVINGDGKQSRDFVYVGDVVAANLAALQASVSGAFNIGTGREVIIDQVANLIRQAVGQGDFSHGPAKPGEQMTSCLDNRLVAKTLGWRPKMPLEEGIAKTVAWFLGQH
ncbi:MAG: UDP-glucose 4-epimerase [Parcubacteria group bacterium Gr01-1014_31]|nr:MAG: UDP-glucose 4-epimerase [Parcubacteria group bacterium Gr01-1014_31]